MAWAFGSVVDSDQVVEMQTPPSLGQYKSKGRMIWGPRHMIVVTFSNTPTWWHFILFFYLQRGVRWLPIRFFLETYASWVFLHNICKVRIFWFLSLTVKISEMINVLLANLSRQVTCCRSSSRGACFHISTDLNVKSIPSLRLSPLAQRSFTMSSSEGESFSESEFEEEFALVKKASNEDRLFPWYSKGFLGLVEDNVQAKDGSEDCNTHGNYQKSRC